jgi:hypothetical protein
MRRRWLAPLIAAGLLALAGCKQGEGDRCEVDNDCSGGLTCENPTGRGGQCTSRPGSSVKLDAAPDARVVDAATADRAVDATGAPDVAPDTAGVAADGAPDTAPSDARDGGDATGG